MKYAYLNYIIINSYYNIIYRN